MRKAIRQAPWRLREHVDEVERLAIERACALFGADWANVQPHSGSQANAAVYQAC